MIRTLALALALAMSVSSAQAEADQDQVGYYYPEVGSEEVFSRTLAARAPRPSREVRVGFITQITKAQLAAPESPRFVIFAKGGEAEHMIIVALDDDIFRTLFRARAVLAQLTSNARGTEFFLENRIESQATWFDLAKLLGFEDLVISDGVTWSHRIAFE
ncbi:MAG: hypothetical protein AAGI34_02620 [Pseudomonadota bacterium]